MTSLFRQGLKSAARMFDAAASFDIAKAQGESRRGGIPIIEAPPPPKSLTWDPFAVVEQVGYKDRPTAISYATLKALVWKNPVVSAVIQARVNQAAAFTTPAADRFAIGYQFKHRDGNRALTKQEKIATDALSRMLQHTAATDDVIGRDNFETFVRKLVWDSLVYDQYCFEVVPNMKGKPCAMYAVDAASIRMADSLALQFNPNDLQASRYVQVFESMVTQEYSREEMCFGVRNPRTEMRLNGYGTSELEMMMSAMTGLLNGMDYNSRFFSQATMAKGIMNIKGVINEEKLNRFQQNWHAMLSGVENAWRTPVLNHDGELQWVNMQSTNRDMEFSSWMDFLIKIVCSFYLMDPSEVNFQYGNAGQTTILADRSNNDALTESRERGLRPILRHLASNINAYIVWPLFPDFNFEFVGLDVMSRSELADLNQKRVQSYYTVDEIRAEEGKPPLPNGQGAIILNSVFIQNMQAMAQGAQGEQQEGDMGGMGDNGMEQDDTPEQAQDTASDNKDRAARAAAANDANNRQQAADAEQTAKSFSAPPRISLDVTL